MAEIDGILERKSMQIKRLTMQELLADANQKVDILLSWMRAADLVTRKFSYPRVGSIDISM